MTTAAAGSATATTNNICEVVIIIIIILINQELMNMDIVQIHNIVLLHVILVVKNNIYFLKH